MNFHWKFATLIILLTALVVAGAACDMYEDEETYKISGTIYDGSPEGLEYNQETSIKVKGEEKNTITLPSEDGTWEVGVRGEVDVIPASNVYEFQPEKYENINRERDGLEFTAIHNPPHFAVELEVEPTVVGPEDEVTLSSKVENTGGQEDTQTIEFYIEPDNEENDNDNNEEENNNDEENKILEKTRRITLQPTEKDQVEVQIAEFPEIEADEYLAVVESDDDKDEVEISVQVGEGEAELSNLDIAGQGNFATVAEGSSENITVDVENKGDDAESFLLELEIAELGENENEVEMAVTTDELQPAEEEEVSFSAPFSGLDADDYRVKVVDDDENSEVQGDLTIVEDDVDEISVLSQPDKLSYEAGDELDLEGLEVALLQDGNVREVVSHGDFEDHYLIADPEDGYELDTDDDGQTVGITHVPSGETAETAELSVEELQPDEMIVKLEHQQVEQGEFYDPVIIVTVEDENNNVMSGETITVNWLGVEDVEEPGEFAPEEGETDSEGKVDFSLNVEDDAVAGSYVAEISHDNGLASKFVEIEVEGPGEPAEMQLEIADDIEGDKDLEMVVNPGEFYRDALQVTIKDEDGTSLEGEEVSTDWLNNDGGVFIPETGESDSTGKVDFNLEMDEAPEEERYIVEISHENSMASKFIEIKVEKTGEANLDIFDFSEELPEDDETDESDIGDVEVNLVERANVETENLVVEIEVKRVSDDADETLVAYESAKPDEIQNETHTVTFFEDEVTLSAGDYSAKVTANADNAEEVTQEHEFKIENED